ncbi:MAG: flavodoxin domain-containing protein [Candidatus Omnitrophica bacterium]|nr:flavodoxin domain-containing protein [Candidatus Omnitrophota bacterium]
MAKALVVYYSRSGNTKKMAALITEGLSKEGIAAVMKNCSEVTVNELLDYDALIIGSPTYYGSMAAEIKKLLDDSVKFHGKLDGRIGGAFASSANIAGGNETTILDILNALLIHGMIIHGDWQGDHYGPVAIGEPDARSSRQCVRYGERVGQLIKKISK